MGQVLAKRTEPTPAVNYQNQFRVARIRRWRYNYEMRLQPIVAVHFDVNDTTDSTVDVSFRLALAEEFRR
jgi:hypothetical protein